MRPFRLTSQTVRYLRERVQAEHRGFQDRQEVKVVPCSLAGETRLAEHPGRQILPNRDKRRALHVQRIPSRTYVL